MKRSLLLILLVFSISFSYGQYKKDDLVALLTSSSSWTVKGLNTNLPVKSYSFNKDFSVKIEKNSSSPQIEKWSLASPDNVRWFITIGNQKSELVVSYDKKGEQYIKLNHEADRGTLYSEQMLYPVK